MRGICVADIHGDIDSVLKLRKSIIGKGFDFVFLFGDYSRDFKDEGRNHTDVRRVLEALSDFKVLALPGNCDHKSVLPIFDELGVNLHNTVLNLPEASIIGFGGSNPTPFKTPFEFSEEEIRDGLNHLHSKVMEGARVIVMTHFPPKDTKCDLLPGGAHVGSEALRAFIEEKKPDLVLCSHIHEAAGVTDEVGGVKILNLGRISDGWAYVLEVSDTVSVDFYSE